MKNPTPYACMFCRFWLRDEASIGWCQLPGNAKPTTREPINGVHRMTAAGLVTSDKAWCPAFAQTQPEDC